MSTRSVVAVPFGDTWRGRYVHWDGHLVGEVLDRIVERDGYDRAVQVLTVEHFGWSSLDGIGQDPDREGSDRFVVVPGYGVAYSADEQPDEWIGPDDLDGLDYLHLLTPEGRRSESL